MAIKSQKTKLSAREKNKIRIRKRVSGVEEKPRLSVFKSSKHTYAQLIIDSGERQGRTIASASTLEESVMKEIKAIQSSQEKGDKDAAPRSASSKSVIAAKAVGIVLARKAKEQKVDRVVFDRNGFIYAGRVQAVADGARAEGLKF